VKGQPRRFVLGHAARVITAEDRKTWRPSGPRTLEGRASIVQSNRRRSKEDSVTKWCPACQLRLPLSEFNWNNKAAGKLRGYCRPCDNLKKRDDAERYRERLNKRAREKYIQKYGMTIEDYDAMLETQGGVCAICAGPNQRDRRFDVDHDHKTGRVRGLLCSRCNVGIGLFKDNQGMLSSAIVYLSKEDT
jgi:hypothetical protein